MSTGASTIVNRATLGLGCLVLVIVLFLFLFPLGAPAQELPAVEEEDLPEGDLTELQILAEDAEAFFASQDQPQSIPLFTQIIDALARPPDVLSEEEKDLLVRCLSFRAQAHFNLAENDRAEIDLERMLELRPEVELDRSVVSPKLLRIFDDLKNRLVGYLELVVLPSDARIQIEGRPVDPYAGPVPLLSGTHVVQASRPGYSLGEKQVEVPAGRSAAVDLTLERVSAALEIRTRPPGASVLVNGQEQGITAGAATVDFLPEGDAARYAREEFSETLLLGDIPQGPVELEIRKSGYRSYRASLTVDAMVDYEVPVVVLEPAQGVVVLQDLPEGASVTVNGTPRTPERQGRSAARLELPPETYRISVSHGTAGVFETSFSLADRETKAVQVRLRPGVAVLGVLGGDTVGAEKFRRHLQNALEDLQQWERLDRTQEGPAILQQAGIDAQQLRLSVGDGQPAAGVDWEALQALTDRETPGALYVLGVLSDDLLASSVDVWIWPAAPSPARPDLLRVGVDDAAALTQLTSALGYPVTESRPWLGALLIDSEGAAAPVVAALTPGGPAVSAGVQVGDEITAFDGTPVFTTKQATELIAQREPGSEIALEVQGRSGTRSVAVRLGSSPAVIARDDPDLIYAAIAARLANLQSQSEQTVPGWALALNQAVVFLQGGAWEKAVRLLRSIEAPDEPGLGLAAVDYWLGLALREAGPSYVTSAREAFSRAAAAPDGRLMHHDGPWVAPRARARLTELGSLDGN